jgi:hypothetical protein
MELIEREKEEDESIWSSDHEKEDFQETKEAKKSKRVIEAKKGKEIIVVFRNKIYKIVMEYESLWYVYEYYASFSTQKDCTTFIAMSIDSTSKNIKAYDKNCEGVLFDNFLEEIEEIKESDVPKRIVECLLNIQRSKVAPEIPYKKILEHEETHLVNLKKEINNAIDTFMMVVYEALAKSKTVVEKIIYVFIANEYKIKNGCKILYTYPNADGKIRATFEEYFTYLFEKLYPRHDTDHIDNSSWFQYVIYTNLKEKYKFLRFEFVGAPNYIEVYLPCKDLLH